MTQIANDELKTAHTELPIPSDLYYGNFHGIIPSYLSTSHAHLRKHARSLVFFAGDSSLDNKYWVLDKNKPVIEPFDTLLSPTVMKPDLAYHLTQLLWASEKMAVMNCSVEATTIADRNKDLLSQDMIIRDNITSDDILIVSIGGNDIALRPSIMTALNLAVLVYLNSFKALDERPETCWGVSHFIRLFKDNIQAYVERLVAKTKPRLCLICTIYYPDEANSNSWADRALNALNYTKSPARVQAAIRALHSLAISQIKIEGVKVVPVPLFSVLTGKPSTDYVARVEPSDAGGLKMAKLFMSTIQENAQQSSAQQ